MRERLVQVLERDDEDEPMDAVVRRFWSRTTRRTTAAHRRALPESSTSRSASARPRSARLDALLDVRSIRSQQRVSRAPASESRAAPSTTSIREGEAIMGVPRSYRTIEEFEREELRPSNKAGFSLDDLMQETMLHESDLLFDDQHDEYEPDEDDDD